MMHNSLAPPQRRLPFTLQKRSMGTTQPRDAHDKKAGMIERMESNLDDGTEHCVKLALIAPGQRKLSFPRRSSRRPCPACRAR
jgi:hypothetical protein